MNREIYNKIREFSVDMYTKGYEEGYEDGKKDSCEIEKVKEFSNGNAYVWQYAYGRGLKDAWECARKIVEMGECDRNCHVFTKCEDGEYPFVKYTVSEALDKIKEYEERKKHCQCINCNHYNGGQWNIFCARCEEFSEYEKQQNSTEQNCDEIAQNEDYNEIRVGDEVLMYDNYKGIVISITYGGFLHILDENGNVWMIYERDNITKTGRNFAQITEALDQIKEEIKE